MALDTYLRPGEVLTLTCGCVLPGMPSLGKNFQATAIHLRPRIEITPTKTGTYDESILLNTPGREWLGRLMEAAVEGISYVHGAESVVALPNPCSDSLFVFATLKDFPVGSAGAAIHFDGGPSSIFTALTISGERWLEIETVHLRCEECSACTARPAMRT